MRGQAKEIKSLIINGRVFLAHEEDIEINDPQKGDIYMYLFLDLGNSNPLIAYYSKGYKGYFKAKIYDGFKWCQIDTADFFQEQENYFSKHEISINVYHLCKEIFEQNKGGEIFRSYRSHYSLEKYEPTNDYKGKKGHYTSSKNKVLT